MAPIFLFLLLCMLYQQCLSGRSFDIDRGDGKTASGEDVQHQFKLTVIVLVCNRSQSFQRLLNSLENSNYDGDDVDLEIHIDYPSVLVDRKSNDGKVSRGRNMTETVSMQHEEVIKVARNFNWKFGHKHIHERIYNVGVTGQWIESWLPSRMNEYSLVLEDDIELSPFYYRWLKECTLKYSSPQYEMSGRIFGVTLQQLSEYFSTDKETGPLPVQNGNNPFAHPILGSWGQLFFPAPWLRFRKWFKSNHGNPEFEPLVPGLINTKWYMEAPKGKIWTQWFIKWANDFGMYTVYSNFSGKRCLSVNYREAGNNYSKPGGPTCKLFSVFHSEMKNIPDSLNFYNSTLKLANLRVLPHSLEA